VKAGPCPIVRVKHADDKDGYDAAVIGLPGSKKMGKRDLGQARGLGNLQYLREFRVSETDKIQAGRIIKVDTFEKGDKVKVIGISKGKGFQGVVKRHGFHGQKATHGTKDQERAPGSIGATEPARVFPGMRMPGHMGQQRVTIKNLEIVKVDVEKNELYIKGAVPGSRGGLLMISADGELKLSDSSADKPAKEEKKEEAPNKDVQDNAAVDGKENKEDKASTTADKKNTAQSAEKNKEQTKE
jgi:large subunit ribosomal protein L3